MPTTSKTTTSKGPRFAELPPEAKFNVIKFGAKWCHYCVMMKNKRTLERFGERRSAIASVEEVDVDKEEARANAYNVKGLPLVIIEDEEGHELIRKGGALSVDELDKLLASATRKWKAKGSKGAKKLVAAPEEDEDEDEDEVEGDEDEDDVD